MGTIDKAEELGFKLLSLFLEAPCKFMLVVKGSQITVAVAVKPLWAVGTEAEMESAVEVAVEEPRIFESEEQLCRTELLLLEEEEGRITFAFKEVMEVKLVLMEQIAVDVVTLRATAGPLLQEGLEEVIVEILVLAVEELSLVMMEVEAVDTTEVN
jgi:hypothetical protein